MAFFNVLVFFHPFSPNYWQNVKLTGTILKGANLQRAYLKGVDLSHAVLFPHYSSHFPLFGPYFPPLFPLLFYLCSTIWPFLPLFCLYFVLILNPFNPFNQSLIPFLSLFCLYIFLISPPDSPYSPFYSPFSPLFPLFSTFFTSIHLLSIARNISLKTEPWGSQTRRGKFSGSNSMTFFRGKWNFV